MPQKNENMSIGVFPEGTRGREEGVAPFSEGCFLIAKKAACPVVVASLKGTDRIHKRFPLESVVELEFVDVIPAETVKEKRSGELSDIAYGMINKSYLAKNRGIAVSVNQSVKRLLAVNVQFLFPIHNGTPIKCC